jgi:hypothetical protein
MRCLSEVVDYHLLFVAISETGSALLFLGVTGPSHRQPSAATVEGMESNPLGEFLRARREQVPASILQLIDGWPSNPAYVQNKFTDVLAVNSLMAAISPGYAPGTNLLRAVFLDPREQELRRDWEEAVVEGVASLRAHVGPDVDDPRLVELVGELSVKSEVFRRLWGQHAVRPKRGRVSRLHHPLVGDLDLTSTKLVVSGADDLILVIFHAEPGSRSAELLGLLGSLTAPAGEPTDADIDAD